MACLVPAPSRGPAGGPARRGRCRRVLPPDREEVLPGTADESLLGRRCGLRRRRAADHGRGGSGCGGGALPAGAHPRTRREQQERQACLPRPRRCEDAGHDALAGTLHQAWIARAAEPSPNQHDRLASLPAVSQTYRIRMHDPERLSAIASSAASASVRSAASACPCRAAEECGGAGAAPGSAGRPARHPLARPGLPDGGFRLNFQRGDHGRVRFPPRQLSVGVGEAAGFLDVQQPQLSRGQPDGGHGAGPFPKPVAATERRALVRGLPSALAAGRRIGVAPAGDVADRRMVPGSHRSWNPVPGPGRAGCDVGAVPFGGEVDSSQMARVVREAARSW